jgi:hypothetical protein
VVRVLEAADQSLRQDRAIRLETGADNGSGARTERTDLVFSTAQ